MRCIFHIPVTKASKYLLAFTRKTIEHLLCVAGNLKYLLKNGLFIKSIFFMKTIKVVIESVKVYYLCFALLPFSQEFFLDQGLITDA